MGRLSVWWGGDEVTTAQPCNVEADITPLNRRSQGVLHSVENEDPKSTGPSNDAAVSISDLPLSM